MNKSSRLLFMASGLMSIATTILILLKLLGECDISNLILSLGFVSAAGLLIAGMQFKKSEDK